MYQGESMDEARFRRKADSAMGASKAVCLERRGRKNLDGFVGIGLVREPESERAACAFAEFQKLNIFDVKTGLRECRRHLGQYPWAITRFYVNVGKGL
jgi:hypothetical protein